MNSEEGIASNILADRLKSLVENRMLTRADDPSHKQKAIYSLTEAGSRELGVRAEILRDGGRTLLADFMDELRETHLGVRRKKCGPTVGARVQQAYEAMIARRNWHRAPSAFRVIAELARGMRVCGV